MRSGWIYVSGSGGRLRYANGDGNVWSSSILSIWSDSGKAYSLRFNAKAVYPLDINHLPDLWYGFPLRCSVSGGGNRAIDLLDRSMDKY